MAIITGLGWGHRSYYGVVTVLLYGKYPLQLTCLLSHLVSDSDRHGQRHIKDGGAIARKCTEQHILVEAGRPVAFVQSRPVFLNAQF